VKYQEGVFSISLGDSVMQSCKRDEGGDFIFPSPLNDEEFV